MKLLQRLMIRCIRLKEWLKSVVFNRHLKTGSDGYVLTSGGKLFQTQATETRNAVTNGGMTH